MFSEEKLPQAGQKAKYLYKIFLLKNIVWFVNYQLKQGGLNKKEIQLHLKIFFILLFNELYLFA